MIVIIMTNINITIMIICIMRDFPVSSVCLYSGLKFSQDLTSGKSCVVFSQSKLISFPKQLHLITYK